MLDDSLGGLSFGTDGEGNYGYFGADGSLIPFNRFILLGTQSNTARADIYTIACDYSKYSYLIITSRFNQDADERFSQLIKIGVNTKLFPSPTRLPDSSDAQSRKITYGDNLLTFTKGSGGSSDYYTIPLAVYGVSNSMNDLLNGIF